MTLAMARRDSLVHVLVTGRHRARFLHAMTTAEVQKLVPGDATLALVATSNGRHVGQLRLEIGPDAITLVTEASSLSPILETLKKHKVADDVRFGEVVPGVTTLAVYGSEPALASLALPATSLAITAWDATRSELGRPALHIRGELGDIERLMTELATRGVTTLDSTAWEAQRIAAGWPRDGVDLGPDDLALFSDRLLGTVSWSKGCFLGQEVFVMARDRGEVPRKLRRVEVPPENPPAPGEKILSDEDKPVGVMGSSVGGRGLAVLKRKHAESGSALRLADGRAVVVSHEGATDPA